MRDFTNERLVALRNWLELEDGNPVAGITDMDTDDGGLDEIGETRFTAQLAARWNACADALARLEHLDPEGAAAILRRAVNGEG